METASHLPLTYLKCHKEGIHDQESLNLVCLEKGCLENLVGCCACIEEDHKRHRVRPLKMLISDIRSQSSHRSVGKVNADIMLDILKDHKRAAEQLFESQKKATLEALDSIERSLRNYFDYIADQILVRNSDSDILLEESLQRASTPKGLSDLRLTLKKLVVVVGEESKGRELSEEELKQSMDGNSQLIQKSLETSLQEVRGRLSKLQNTIAHFITSDSLWRESYRFSSQYKHNDVKLITDKRIKAVNSQGYKFAVMVPETDKVLKQTFSYTVKEIKGNWLAIGFCFRPVIESKNYSFVFGSTGHGAYMISSNGGSWSHHKADQNNTLKAIKFGKGDTIHATIDPATSKITFRKNTHSEQYELAYELGDKQELSPCVLFYYMNDEVEYLPNPE